MNEKEELEFHEVWDALCDEGYRTAYEAARKCWVESKRRQKRAGGEFISTKELMPEIGEYVLLMADRYWNTPDGVTKMRVTATGYLADLGGLYWYIFGERGMKIDSFTHWMPINTPKDYNHESEGE